MAGTRKLPRDEWADYFDRFTKRFLRDVNPEEADIHVLSPDIGAQVEAERVRLDGITYDRKDNVLEFVLHQLDHLIYNPEEIWVQEEEIGFIRSIEVVRDDDTREIIELRQIGIRPADY